MQLLTPPSRPPAETYTNLNGKGGRKGLAASILLGLLMTAMAWLGQWEELDGRVWVVRFLGPILTVWSWWHWRNLAIVDYSSQALRVTIRRQTHAIPFSDMKSVSEGGLFSGGGSLFPNQSRKVTVILRKPEPFGGSFTFFTKAEYGMFDGESGPAKLIEQKIRESSGPMPPSE